MMSQIAKYHRPLKRKYQHNKGNNKVKIFAQALQMEMKYRSGTSLQDLIREKYVPSKSRTRIREKHMPSKSYIIVREKHVPSKFITIRERNLSIMISRPDSTTRKMLDCMRKNNFKGIMEYMNTIGREDYSAMVDFCECLETAIGIMRITADNSMRKITLEDYQRGLLDIMQAARALKDNPRNVSRRRDLENGLNAFLRRLEAHAVLTEILEEHGETEEDLDKQMSASMLKF